MIALIFATIKLPNYKIHYEKAQITSTDHNRRIHFRPKWRNGLADFRLGRNLAEGFIPHWTNALTNAEPEPGADKMVNTPKVVFTKTLEKSVWENTVLAKGDLVKEINALKQKPGGDMIVYGGGKFVSSLIKEKLIDELHLFINPAVIGNGMTIFASVTEKQNYQLLNVKSFDCGIVVLTYKTI